MGKLSKTIVVASVLAISPVAAASAADLGIPEPIPVPVPAPVSVPCCDATWYFKAFVGVSNQEVDEFTNDIIAAGNFTIFNKEFDSAPFVGLGVGYQHSDKLRFDVTGEYRGRATFHGLDKNNTAQSSNDYSGFKSEWLFLANAYFDFGDFHGVKPYVGAGAGVAEVTLSNFTDTNERTGGHHWAAENSEWNFAWALHAGLAYEVSDALTLDFGYRYLNLGDGVTGTFQTYDGTASPGPLELKDIVSHDIMVGLRWTLGEECCAAPPPPPPVYAPPPYK